MLFGRLPDFTIPCSPAVLVNAAIQSSASALFWLAAGIARSEPPANAGIVLPATWLGIAKAEMTDFNFGLPALGSSA